ncbi:MAG: hypothetical protein ABR986_08525 [Methanomassiliicoccales archaeon]|jgi:hypothetical protein
MSRYNIAALIDRAKGNEIGESLAVLISRSYCRISLVARNNETECSLFLEAVARYDVQLSSTDSTSRKRLVHRLGSLGFQLVQENGSKVYELKISESDIGEVMVNLLIS